MKHRVNVNSAAKTDSGMNYYRQQLDVTAGFSGFRCLLFANTSTQSNKLSDTYVHAILINAI